MAFMTVQIEDILTKEQLKELKKVIQENNKLKIKPLDTKYTESLKALFNKYRKQLIEKGVLPEYLAYAIGYKISQNPEVFMEKLKQVV